MTIELLGPLRVDGEGVSLQRRDHVVLLALSVRAGEVVPADRLAEALWGDAVPPSWQKVVQGCVLRLRRRFGHALIETAPAGYRLTVTEEALDTWRFEELIQRGRLLAAAGEYDRAAVAFGRALELWRGPPFDVLDSWSPGQIEATRLEELRRTAEESVLEARLHSGEHREVVPIAEARVSEEPLREHRWALLALSLYRCGRQADALRALKRARSTLVEQLGIEPGAELVSLEAAILRQDETLLAPPSPPTISDRCPYRGLAPYDVDDTGAFFGRDDEIASCLQRLAEHSLLVITGPSGCGKSSLIRAGVVPALRRAGHTAVVFSPGDDPAAAMASALAACDGTPVLVVDQFEELFGAGDDIPTAVSGFCAQLAGYAADQAPVVVVVRADHVASLAAYPSFARLAERGVHLVTPLAGDSLRHAIEGPAQQAGLRVEHGLVDLLVRDCEGEPGALPLLSHALAETWQRRDGRVLTVEAYRATGEIRGAVARTADRLYESLPAEQRPKLRSLLLRLVSPTADGEPMRSRVATRTLGADADRARVLGLLVRARLVTADDDSIELAHEALARAWPRLRSWLDEDAAGLRILRHLSAAAEGWDSLGRPESELYRGARLEAANEWRAANPPDLTAEEVAFLDASTSAVERERRQAADQAAAQARQRRRHRAALASVAVLLVAAAAGGIAAYAQRQQTHRQQWEAEVRALASTSQALRSTQPDVAALLALEAHSMDPSAASESALFGTFTAAPGLLRTTSIGVDFGQPRVSGSYLPDGETVAVADGHGAVHVINLTDGAHEQLPPLSETGVGRTVVAASTNGRFLAVLWYSFLDTDHSLLTVWDLETGEQRFEPVSVAGRRSAVTVSANGATVAVGGYAELPTELRDGATGAPSRTVAAIPAPPDVSSSVASIVAFAPDGRLAVGSRAGPIRFIDPATGDENQRIDAPPRSSESALLFDTDGTVLFAVGHGGFISYDVETGQALANGVQGPSFCASPVYSAAMRALLCTTSGGDVVASGVTGRDLDLPNYIDTGTVCGLMVSADGATLTEISSCVSGGATIREWLLDGGGAVSHLAYAPQTTLHTVEGYGFAGDSTALRVWIARTDDTATVIDPASGEVIDEFPLVYGLRPTDDPNVVYALLGNTSVGRYDVVHHVPVTPVDLGFHINADGWSSRGSLVAVGGNDATGYPIRKVRVVDFAGTPALGPLIDGTGKFDVVNLLLDTHGLMLALSLDDGNQFRIERHDAITGELFGDPADGYRDFASNEAVTLFVTADGRLLQVDPDTLTPIGLPFGNVSLDESLVLDDEGQRVAILGGNPLGPVVTGADSLRLYDVASRTQLGAAIELGENEPNWTGAAFSPNGMELAVDTEHGIVVWDLDPDHWVEAACDLAGRNLTQAEWDQHIGDLAPYRTTCPQFPID